MRLFKNSGLSLLLSAVLLLSTAAGFEAQAGDSRPRLGSAPVFSGPGEALFAPESRETRAAGLSVDPSRRASARSFYFTYYADAAIPPIDWTGSISPCNAGTTADAFKDAVMLRINYYRAMAGVPAGISNNSQYSQKAQEAALMMAKNDKLSHEPPTSWECYTVDGAEAAGRSNLALGTYGPWAIDLYMKDPGAGNYAAGHRRWLLYPQSRSMGTGDIPPGSSWAANALWAWDDYYSWPRPATRETYVAWPPPGYVPYPVVFPRWSFAYDGADFSNATVSVTRSGTAVPLSVHQYLPGGYGGGENTLVWLMDNMSSYASWPKPEADETYRVTIDNVIIGDSPRSFTYSVVVFDPETDAPVIPLPGILPLLLDEDTP